MSKKGVVPRKCCKYYLTSSLAEFVDAGVASEEETSLLQQYVSKILESKGMKLIGWAKAKDRYIDVLAYYEIPYVAIIETEVGQKVLADVTPDSVTIVTRELLDSYF